FAMLMPMAWEKVPDLPPPIRAFYEYHAHVQEPWDGPAAVVFCDGRMVGATLDRNGLRPLRYAITDTGLIFASSEIGAVPCEPAQIVRVGKLGPGQLMALDLTTGEFFKSKQIKRRLAAQQPYVRRLQKLVNVPRLPKAAPVAVRPDLVARQVACGYTRDDSIFILKPMAINRSEPVGSMGDDTPPAVLSAHPRSLFGYFRQRFAEVTNPPIDPLREGLVMSLRMSLGRRGNALDAAPWQHPHVVLATPFLAPNQLDVLIRAAALPSARLETGWPTAAGPSGLASTLTRLQTAARQAVKGGAQLLVLSDRELPDTHAIIPAALAVGAVHHDLVRAGLRSEISLIIDSGEPRSVHDMAVLIGYGANVVCPHLALETVAHLGANDPARATANYIGALEKGLLKIMSKMGISTVDAYCGAQIFECIGLSSEVVAAYFTGTPAHLGGATLRDIARLVLRWQANATAGAARLTAPGFFKFKRGGELHAFAPDIVRKLQRALASTSERDFFDGFELYMQFVRATEERDPIHLRDLLDIRPAGPYPIPLNQVEPREALVQRFSTAAMSHGSLSSEAHETLAIAMNRLDSASNSGEGGERSERFGSERNSSIKQVASGRFGVTPAYLLAADELQIKMAQGAKPGEGGRLPGHKVTPEIASIRHARPGVTLISPPPQHDIYSIEDLSQLIFDLRQINPRAKISVKLVAQSGIGTIAAGVAKAGADVIVIAGRSGGTGAAPWSSIKHAGLPWEIGLVETQRALIRAGLRGRVRLRADGGFCTGRDVLFAALLGADEFSFGTSALVAAGCVLARTCHTNNCPVGVATQRADLRAKYTGTPEQVMTYFHFVAEELRRRLAALGETRLKHLIGRTDLLAQTVAGRKGEPPLDLRELLRPLPAKERRYLRRPNPTARLDGLNESLLAHAAQALHAGAPVNLRYSITNRTRAFGATLSGEIIRLHGPAGLPEGTVAVTCFGTAGQSFGAFCAPGVQLNLYGPANDYVGKGMAGGTIVITSDEEYRGEHPFLAGNTILYGATGGELFIAGRVGERFAVRNSGAFAIAEDVGDHGCEYMTGGTVVVLGTVGHNFAAGMTGGVAYVYDRAGHLAARLNRELVTQQPLATGEARQLARWLLRHAELTGSPLADQLLANWDEAQAYFACIRPKQPPAATVDAVAPFSRELTTA
ncbi:MAG: glutamate synthase large subunit, partial [Anaerolineales bacterium]